MTEPRILQIVHDHPDVTNGGTEWIAADLTRALRRSGAPTTLLAASTSLSRPEMAPGSLAEAGEDLLLRTGRYDAFAMLRLDGSGWIAALERILGRTRPDIVHLHGLDRIGSDVVAAIRSRSRARIVVTLHDFQPICAKDGLMVTSEGALCSRAEPARCRQCLPELSVARHALREAHLKAVLSGVDLVVLPSRFAMERYAAWGLPREKMVLLPNGVPGRAPALPVQGHRFAFFGNVADHKGVHVLLDAAARLAAREADLRITIHGGFTWSAEAERAGFEAALARAAPLAHNHGPYDRSDLPGLMDRTDWVVVPSTWWENAPLVILEAQRSGRPVICTGIGGMAEAVEDGRTGLHVPRNDPAALAETIARADADLCRRLAANIRPPTDTDAMAQAHLAQYRRLCQEALA
ncbi:glycosyltransferase involved in cell wall biosynthesis [Palleronia aestuarii]|uniref:Glycosyltransferase involved in cell wall biosynthesis n=1 Tax=Palleronia aestuarii TaxID=568105 RepID=A0A2W7NAM2_9RHOB|nr:glycosyltransferase [Palleronia aestuarii]PZX17128.1 glycosyltransferase involved in cell wall biosynthesis [Palleronia aestuarii]